MATTYNRMGWREVVRWAEYMADESYLGIDDLTDFESIGSGGFSTVYSAWDVVFQRRVAVKVLARLAADDQRRFERELRITGQLSSHPNVIMPFRAGYTAVGAPFLVMEHVAAGSLADLVAKDGPIPWRRAVAFAVGVADALAHAHSQGVLHRDVKPANILLAAGDVPKLTDFGIAGIHEATTSQVGYTLAHCPPETFGDGHDARDERSDLYSTASTLYWLIEGRAPFDVDSGTPDSHVAYMYRIVDHEPQPMRHDVPGSLRAAIDQALNKDPNDRHESAAAFASVLRRTIAQTAALPPEAVDARADAPARQPIEEPDAQSESEDTGLIALAGAEPATQVDTPAAGRRTGAPTVVAGPGMTADHSPIGLPDGAKKSRARAWAVATIAATLISAGVAVAVMALVPETDGNGSSDAGLASAGGAGPPDEAATETVASPPLAGTEVSVVGPEATATEVEAIQTALDKFADEHDMTISYEGSPRLISELLNATPSGAGRRTDDADILIVAQHGVLRDLVDDGRVVPLSPDAEQRGRATWDEEWMDVGRVDGRAYGLPTRSEVKSLVWYQPGRFEELGYDVPSTLEELEQLTVGAAGEDIAPWCVGLGSGANDGWPFTDWVEDFVLALHGPGVYDDWVAGRIAFSDPRILAAIDRVGELWSLEGAVFTTSTDAPIGATPFTAGADSLVAGDCLMVRQGSFFAAAFPADAVFGGSGADAIDVFLMPPVAGGESSAVTWTVIAAATEDRPEVEAVLTFLASADFANERQAAQSGRSESGLVTPSGFLSAADGVDPDLLSPIDMRILELLAEVDVRRLDASDAMPPAVGTGTFWSEGIAFANGDATAEDMAQAIDDSWPLSP